jgi:hypothetical protein
MDIPLQALASPARASTTPLRRRAAQTGWRSRAVAALLLGGLSAAAQAIDFGPFSLTGFGKFELTRGTDQCPNCAVNPYEGKDKIWADPLIPGSSVQTRENHVTLVQPYLGVKFDLPKGFKVGGLISKRWRDGKEDIKGFWWDKNVYASHEDYGRLAVGAMLSRSWSLADYPFGSDIGVSSPWASSGAGYGLLGHAVRYTTRPLDVSVGDLVLEATYDKGASGWEKNKPRFFELYAQFYKEGLVVDMIYQDARNGTPSSWGQGPFTGLTPFPRDDLKLGGSGQSIAMVMARYRLNPSWEVLGGLRQNRWSGAYARITVPAAADRSALAQWNTPFNVDWFCAEELPARCSIDSPGYPARSIDGTVGVRYSFGQWTAHTGLLYLGQAKTKNPTERGQSNAAMINTVGLEYDFRNGLKAYGLGGMVRYKQLGLSPLSMPGNSSFTNVDSRASKSGNWFGAGAVYTF